ncbi:hepatic triacylglycerol lipase isoform X1 [Meriones unguiculatus]|uniref:hepatic triacylglycerol lipase isoform X1 n=1 Tax=Meriones unguiculatus TaxID=10047 RepID=UPI00293E484E|nr:hepatic triacylglycerol lipase isoform X1 [Meriones unguiculatus]XP_060240795.1 hepatic triacylglycerol lipase isoform X1 [Meriones unguiculatus]
MGSSLRIPVLLVLCIFIQSSACGQDVGTEPFGRSQGTTKARKPSQESETRFLLFKDKDDRQGCQLRLQSPETLQECGFNSSQPLVMVIHGWSGSESATLGKNSDSESQVDGLLESWIWKMVGALKSQQSQPVNVGLVYWISLAYQHYAVAVRNTRIVGQEVAALLLWLEESVRFSRSKVHLIGYSLGAHVSGFAGSAMGGKHKIGRITGLDPAGPLFEGASPNDRLSPDDAYFVDAIHTFTREHMGLSVGIKQPVAHYDFYPNGGSFQPGCHFLELYKHIAEHGLNAITQTIKCAHERSVHLFVDSLLHSGLQSTGFQCSDMDSFSQGLCLNCKRGRCNTMGYDIRRNRSGKSRRLFLITRAQSPFRVYHYQFKIQFINQIEKPGEPTFTMSLLGTKGDMKKIPITLGEGITSNKTYSFLITLDKDIGQLIVIKFKWENSAVWANVWNTVQTIMPWGMEPHYSGLMLKTIWVKAGETQQRMTFCPENVEDLQLHPTQEKVFVKCELTSKRLKRKGR